MLKKHIKSTIFVFFSVALFSSCKKSVQVDPPVAGLVSSTIYSNNITAAAAMTSIYDRMSGVGLSAGSTSISLRMGLYADELKNYLISDVQLPQFYSNSLSSSPNPYFWNELYQQIYVANAVLEGLTASSDLSAPIKHQLTGEAKFMRAFLFFYAVNLYGDVPLVTSSDYRVNNVIYRSPKVQIYEQIISDLREAQTLLNNSYSTSTGSTTVERVRPNRSAATALLARAYLYSGNWVGADSAASAVIANPLYSLSPLTGATSVFMKNSNEAIWQLQPVIPGANTYDAPYFVLTSAPGTSSTPVAINTNLLTSFETGDLRKNNWIGSITVSGQTYFYPFKYKVNLSNQPVTEYAMVLRLAEQYLIRSEARAQQNNLAGAQIDLNIIRSRSNLPNTTATTQAALLTAILHERQVELFTEWGHRWFDLKRYGTVDAVMSIVTPQKGGVWNSNSSLLPIPQSEILINPNLVQNQGY